MATNKKTNTATPTKEAVGDLGNKKVESDVTEYIEGTAQVIPNSNFKCKKIYGIRGLGKIFDGNYYVQKVTHSISSNYTVSMEVTQVQKIVLDVKTNESRKEAVAPTTPKTPEAPKYKVITIKWGDTLWALSRKYGTTVSELAKINNIKNPDLIYAGASLKVPS